MLLLIAVMAFQSAAQNLATKGKSVDEIVPKGWEHSFEKGDLNKDGINDLVIIATPNDSDKITIRDDGYVYNFNQPVLAIYWGQRDGSFKLFKQYDNVIPARPSEYNSIDASISICDRYVLKIILDHFSSAGGWDSVTTTHLFRFQNGDFFLIGKDENITTRNTGKVEETSDNYLTHKRCVSTSNISSSKKPKSKWTALPKKPLLHLGFPLE